MFCEKLHIFQMHPHQFPVGPGEGLVCLWMDLGMYLIVEFRNRLVKRCFLQLQCRGESDGSPISCLGGLVACVSQADLPDLDPGASENSNGSLTLVVLGWFVCLTWTCFCVTEGVALGKLAIKADKGRLNLLTSINRKTEGLKMDKVVWSSEM